ncbi:MAG: urate oxidase [Thermoanaerobaculia bacterium]
MKLESQNYGKQRVRVMKVLRDAAGDASSEPGGPHHEVKELEVGVRLEGDFGLSYTSADNSKVVPTDTMKNTVHVLAHRHLGVDTEPFALLLAEHFLRSYDHVGRVSLATRERRWNRMVVDGKPHGHSFVGDAARPTVRLVAERGGRPELESGIEDLLILKSTRSGFAGFPRDAYTTLPDADDRILSTLLAARWRFREHPASFQAANQGVLAALLEVFAGRYSPSVQATIWEMAEAAFAACPEIDRVTLALPNKHYLPVDLSPFGVDGAGVSFLPTDEPHGQIEATVSRA